MSVTSSSARRSAASSSGRESGLRPGAPKARRTSVTSSSSPFGRVPRSGRGPSRSVSRRSWTSTRHGTPAYVISAAARAPDDSAASSSLSRTASLDASTAASCRAASRSARRCSAVSSIENRAGSDRALGPSRSQCSDCSPSSSRASTAGARRSRWWPSRRSWQRSTRTPAASSPGSHRAVSSHPQRGASTSRTVTYAGRSTAATSCSRSPSTTSARSPGRRDSETRLMRTPRSGGRRCGPTASAAAPPRPASPGGRPARPPPSGLRGSPGWAAW